MPDSSDILSSISDVAAVYPVFRDLAVPGADPDERIDAVLLAVQGIFVFEAEDRAGWIFGSARQAQWTDSLSKDERVRFANPVLRNRTHVRAIAAFLGVPERAFRSYLVFGDRCVLKDVPADTVARCICQRPALRSRLRTDLRERMAMFDEARLRTLEDRLGMLADATPEQLEAALRTCPLCGKPLVERRRASDGSAFIGCSGYPRCRYTRRDWQESRQ